MWKKMDLNEHLNRSLSLQRKQRKAFLVHISTITICSAIGFALPVLLFLGALDELLLPLIDGASAAEMDYHTNGVIIVTTFAFEALLIFGFISAFLERGQTLHTYLSGLFVGWCLSNAFVVFYLTGSENSAPAVKLVSIFTVSYGLVYTLANVTRYLWSRAKLNVRKQAELRLKYLDEEKSIARTRKNTKDCDPVSAPEFSVFERNLEETKKMTVRVEKFLNLVDEIDERKLNRIKHVRGLNDRTSSMWSLQAPSSPVAIRKSQSHDCLFHGTMC